MARSAVIAVLGVLAFSTGTTTGAGLPSHAAVRSDSTPPRRPSVVHAPAKSGNPAIGARGIEVKALTGVVKQYCQSCHNPKLLKGNLNLEGFNVDSSTADIEVSEKVIRKLRTAMMPPPTSRKPGGDTLVALVETMEQVIDRESKPNPGSRPFQRLNRPEYEAAVRDLLSVEVNAGDFLPLDTKSANFDNIADVQALSPTMLDAYLNAAAVVSRMAVGDKSVQPIPVTYRLSPFVSQHPWEHVEGTPYGTRGGVVEMHTFPADGKYVFRANIGGGLGTRLEDLDFSVDGERIALLAYEKGIETSLSSADAPQGADFVRTEPILIKGGQRKISVSFVRRNEGPFEDLIRPHDWSMASNGSASAGTTAAPHVIELTVTGPEKALGLSESVSRKKIFTCTPKTKLQELPCAEQVISKLATRAYRRPLAKRDTDALMKFYKSGAAQGGFDEGVRTALQAVLASPYFVFRFEKVPAGLAPGRDYAISDVELASRLSFFLWGSIPDDRLLSLATAGTLSQPLVLNAEVKRMLTDPRSEALAPRFAAQWLRLQDLEKVHPDAFFFPDFDQQMADAMHKETELFFMDIVRNDRSVFDLYTADWTYVNERLAKHYGIPNVAGDYFRKVSYPDTTRRGLLGQGSILVQTSLANRTSPVLRGKWVMQVLLGAPPPPPPPDVPALDETGDGLDGRQLTTRERMEIHRKNPTCNACHQYIDPIGLSLDNFDVTGKWRFRENGVLLDTKGKMYDGRIVSSPTELLTSLMSRPTPLVRTLTENLMAYAIGRRVEDFDQPAVRAIVRESDKKGNKFSSLVTAIVNSPAFRKRRADPAASNANGDANSKSSQLSHQSR